MKKLATLALLLIGSHFYSNAQTAEKIIKTYIENIGGEEALRRIKSTKMNAKVNQGGMSIPLTIINMSDGKMIVKFELQGKEMVQQAFDGEIVWGTNFMTQKAEKKDEETAINMKRESADFPDPFLDYEKKGYKIELIGKETIEGTECFKIKITKKPSILDGKDVENISFYYFDTENYIPIVSESEIKSGQMKGSTSQVIYSDYQEVEGVYFPFSMIQKVKGQPGQPITIEKIELNVEVDDNIFKFPKNSSESKESH